MAKAPEHGNLEAYNESMRRCFGQRPLGAVDPFDDERAWRHHCSAEATDWEVTTAGTPDSTVLNAAGSCWEFYEGQMGGTSAQACFSEASKKERLVRWLKNIF